MKLRRPKGGGDRVEKRPNSFENTLELGLKNVTEIVAQMITLRLGNIRE
jgi:hypothetical protein